MVFPAKVKIKLYYALFAAHLNYCSPVWATTTNTNILKIQTVQEKFMSLVPGVHCLSPKTYLTPITS